MTDKEDLPKPVIMGPFTMPGKKETTLAEHYGVKQKDFKDMCDDILCQLIKIEDHTTLIDELFSELDGMGRLRVIAYHDARLKLKRIEEPDKFI